MASFARASVVLAALAALAASAALFVIAPASAAAPVTFVDDRPLSVEMSALRAAGKLDVAVRNTSDRSQQASVRVVGLEPAEGERDPLIDVLFASEGASAQIAPGAEATVSLPVGLGAGQTPRPGNYSGRIVAAGELGELRRRALTIRVTEPAPAPADAGSALTADNLSDLTLSATNRFPSLLDPAGPTLIVGALLLAALAVVFASRLAARGRRGWLALAALAGLVAASLAWAGDLGAFKQDRSDQDGWHSVAAPQPAVASSVPAGTVGVVAHPDGDLARLVVDDGRLQPRGLARAGTYAGTLDLRPGKDGGEAKATVNVRDWWPWALMFIAAGVGIGYLVRRFFERDRPAQRIHGRLADLRRQINADDSQWQSRASGGPHAGYTMTERASVRAADIERLASEAKIEEAETALDALDQYTRDMRLLRNELAALAELVRALEQALVVEDFGAADRGRIQALVLAEDVMGAEFDSADSDAEAELLKEARTDVADAGALLIEVARAYDAVRDAIATARQRMRLAGADLKKQFEEAIQSLEGLGAELLDSRNHDAAVKVAERIAAEARELPKIKAPDRGPALADEHDLRPLAPGAGIGAGAAETADAVAAPAAIEVRVLGGAAADGANVDDLYELSVVVPAGAGGGAERVVWDFSDGSPQVAQRLDAGRRAVVRHQFAAGGVHTVTLRSAAGTLIAQAAVEPAGPSRVERLRRGLAFREREMTLIAALLALGLGLLTLYFADAAWGQPDDYLKAVLWGGVVTEGITLVGALVARTWPGG